MAKSARVMKITESLWPKVCFWGNLSVTLCCFALLLLTSAQTAHAALLREPYLQLVTPTSVVVVWRTDLTVTNDSRVQYGTDSGNLNQTANGTASTPGSNSNVKDHIVTITGLNPGTKYFYNVGTTSGGVEGGGTAEHYWVTAPVAGSPTAFTAWVLGDSGTGSSGQRAVRNAMLAETTENPPDIILQTGDIAYNDGTDAEFTSNHFAVYEDILRHTVLWPATGDHGNGPTYFDAHVLPASGEAGGAPSGTEAFYSFDYANVHFIVLDSISSSTQPNSPMLTWLQADLAASSWDWIIAYWHTHPYSQGHHNSDCTNCPDYDMREVVLPVLEAGGVDLVLTGHSHNYQRSFMIDQVYGLGLPTPSFGTLSSMGKILGAGDGDPSGDGPYVKNPGQNPNEGTVYVVAGHGGRTLRATGGLHPVMYFEEVAFGSGLLDVNGNILTFRNLRSDGAITDEFSIVKIAPTVPPDAPTNLTAAAASPTRATLSWTDNSDNEFSFDIERSTNGAGGPFTLLQVVGGNATTYEDIDLNAETEYCYRVRADNPIGPSAFSNVDCATTPEFGPSLVAHWQFDEVEGTMASDASGNGHVGTLVGAPVWAMGQLGGALDFDGDDDYVEVNDNDALDLTEGSYTLSAWINPRTFGQNTQGRIIDKGGASASNSWALLLDNSNAPQRLQLRINDASGIASNDNTITLDTWQHVAVVVSGSSGTFYINGIAAGGGSGLQSPGAGTHPVRIGLRATDFNRDFDGRIDDVRIYDRALAAEEILQLFNPENQAPTVNAGADQTIVLANAATLDGAVTDDGLPNPPGAVTTTWSKVSGPGMVTFGATNAVDTTASFSELGVYVLALTADDSEFDPSDEVTITVDSDTDGDNVADSLDNCILAANNTQTDSDSDGYGNACDADFNNDGIINGLDTGIFVAQFGTVGPDADLNNDYVVNGLDVGLFVSMFGQAPGPSALAP